VKVSSCKVLEYRSQLFKHCSLCLWPDSKYELDGTVFVSSLDFYVKECAYIAIIS
jgi:hypothetical protein